MKIFVLIWAIFLGFSAQAGEVKKVSVLELVQILKLGESRPEGMVSCRADGMYCQGSYQCCGICDNGVCKYGSGGGGGCRKDGYSCQGSYECCGICDNGVCKYGGEEGSCRPEGLACEGSYQCCGICDNGVCKF